MRQTSIYIYDLCLSLQPEEKTYEQLIRLYNKHFKFTISVFSERCEFYNSRKHREESIADWAARVRLLVTKYKFDQELEVILRDKFIMGLKNPKMMDRLFEEKPTMSLDKAIEIASVQAEKN